MEYISKNRKKYYLKIHLIMVIKYRKGLLGDYEIDTTIKKIFNDITHKYDFKSKSKVSKARTCDH